MGLGWVAGFGLAAARAASRVDRVAPVWFVFGAILGPIALLLLGIAPHGRCDACANPTRGWPTTCAWCGERLPVTPWRPFGPRVPRSRAARVAALPAAAARRLVADPGPADVTGSSGGVAGSARNRSGRPAAEGSAANKPAAEGSTAQRPVAEEPVGSTRGKPAAGGPAADASAAGDKPTPARRAAPTPPRTRRATAPTAPAEAGTVRSRAVGRATDERPARRGRAQPTTVGKVGLSRQTADGTASEAPAAAASEVTAAAAKSPAPAASGVPAAAPAASAPPTVATPPADAEVVDFRILTTAVYVTGSSPLLSGCRYIIGLHGDDLRILGPVDVNPSAITMERPLAGMDATANTGRLVVTGPSDRRPLILMFTSIAGATPDSVAEAIVAAARSASQATA